MTLLGQRSYRERHGTSGDVNVAASARVVGLTLPAFFLFLGCGTQPERPPKIASGDKETSNGASWESAIGKRAPEIEGVDTEGKPLKLSDFRGKVVLLSFWADFCVPCRDLFPHERSLVEKHKGRPFVLLGVNVDGKREDAQERVLSDKLTWRSWWDGERRIHDRFGLSAIPALILIDGEGIVRDRLDASNVEELNGRIEKLLAR